MARKRRPTTLLADTLEAQAAMWTTLGVRVPQLLAGTMSPAESQRMVAEKIAALAESTQAASLAAGRVLLDPMALRSPAAMLSAWTAVSAAAARPFHTRVTANAKRLSRPRRKPSA